MCRADGQRRFCCVAWLVVGCALAGCVQKMADEGRIKPFQASSAFDNDMSAREPVPGTVARGQLQLDTAFFTGEANHQYVTELPQRALEGRSLGELLARGRERFGIYCSQCHGLVGGGTGGPPMYEKLVGMVVLRGFPSPPTYHQDRLRAMPLGHFFDVITNGYGRMPAHGYLIAPDDRWAIAAYIRALQLSQYAPRDELPPATLDELGRFSNGHGQSPAKVSRESGHTTGDGIAGITAAGHVHWKNAAAMTASPAQP